MKLTQITSRYPNLSALLTSAAFSVVVFFVVLFTSFNILVYFYPSYTIDLEGSRVYCEALGQLLGSAIISGIVSLAAFIIFYIKLGNHFGSASQEGDKTESS